MIHRNAFFRICLFSLFALLGSAQTQPTAAQLANAPYKPSPPFAGLQNAMAQCLTTGFCPILIPSTYTQSFQVPGYILDPNQPPSAFGMRPNTIIYDQRFGDARLGLDATGYNFGLTNTPNGWIFDYSKKTYPMAIHVPLYIMMNIWDGGTNGQNSNVGYYDKTTYSPLSLGLFSHSPGQHIPLGLLSKTFSTGDTLGIANYIYCYGGFVAQADEGCEAQDNQVFQGNVEYSGSIVGSPTSQSVTVNVTQGANTQGAGRFLARTSAAISTGTISAINPSPPATLTGSGTNWPVSVMIGTLGTAVPVPGVATVTPTFSLGSLASITPASTVCVADGAAFEMINPASMTASTMTATFTKPHTPDAIISSGGVCGMLLDLTADDVNNSTFPNMPIQGVQGTLHFAWPGLTSTATSMTIYVAGGGGWQQLVSRWDANTANGYTLYPMAEVVSTQQGGGISNTLTLGPNNAGWTFGDTVSEFLYPANHFTFGNNVITAYYPNFPWAAGGFGLVYNMPLQGNDTMLGLTNNAPLTMYKQYGGKYDGPWGIHIKGATGFGIFSDLPGGFTTYGVGCGPCTGIANVMAAGNAYYYDFIQYDQVKKQWMLTTNSNSARYTFGQTFFGTPFPNVYAAADAANVGYVAVQSIRTQTTSNTDAAGELSFASATSQTYTMLGSYNAHPECWAYPQFDLAGARLWISYTAATSFTVNASAPITGQVSYGCIARN